MLISSRFPSGRNKSPWRFIPMTVSPAMTYSVPPFPLFKNSSPCIFPSMHGSPAFRMPPSSVHHHIPLSLFLSSCGLPPCQEPFYLLFFPASCKISSFFRFIGFISRGDYLDKKKRFYVYWGILLECCILEMKKFMKCRITISC